MAALLGRMHGDARQSVHRTGHRDLTVHADTFHTFASIEMRADGSGAFVLRDDDGAEIAGIGWGPESEPSTSRVIRVALVEAPR